jgi:hypothetical protein
MTRQEWIDYHVAQAPDITPEQWRETLAILEQSKRRQAEANAAGIDQLADRSAQDQRGAQTRGTRSVTSDARPEALTEEERDWERARQWAESTPDWSDKQWEAINAGLGYKATTRGQHQADQPAESKSVDPAGGHPGEGMTEYRSHGVPLESYKTTKKDHRSQHELEEMMKWVEIQVAKFPTRISEAKAQRLVSLLGLDEPAPQQMRWRVRLYCGHIIEVTRHAGDEVPNTSVCRYERCAPCTERKQMIAAYEPIGLLPPPPTQPATKPRKRARTSVTRTKAELQSENATLMAEVERLRALRDDPPTA